MFEIENFRADVPRRIEHAANDNYRGWATIRMPPDEVLREPAAVEEIGFRLSLVYDREGLSRRRVIDWLAETVYPFDGEITNSDGSLWRVEDIDVDAPWGKDETFSWVRSLLIFSGFPPKQKMQRRVVPRLRLIYLALAIDMLKQKWRHGMNTPHPPF